MTFFKKISRMHGKGERVRGRNKKKTYESMHMTTVMPRYFVHFTPSIWFLHFCFLVLNKIPDV